MKIHLVKIVIVISILLDTTFAGVNNFNIQTINVIENDSVIRINKKIELIPKRPIVKTIAGYALTIEGVLAIGAGIIIMAKTKKIESNVNSNSIGSAVGESIYLLVRSIGICATVEGIGCTIPGTILLFKANNDWKVYNEYKNKQIGNDYKINLNFAFEY